MRLSGFCEDLLNELRLLLGENKVYFFNNDFASEESIARVLKNSPIVFVDFIGDSFIKNTFTKLCEFEISIIHATPSVNTKNREASFKEQMNFLERIENHLFQLKFNHAGVIMPTTLSKEYSEMTKNGFLSIYKRRFEVMLYIENPYEEV